MRVSAILTAVLVALTAPAAADPSSLLAPDDPANASGWHPPPPVTAGLEAYAPVEPKDWLKLQPKGADPMGSMKDMPGMKGMKDMPGMDMPGMGGGK